jgi:hypothetical protein
MTNHLRRAMLVAAVTALYFAVPAQAAQSTTAQNSNTARNASHHSVIITLDETLKIPGKTLVAGAYLFELADNDTVKITRAKDNKVITTAKVMRIDHPPQAVGLAITVARADSNDEFPTLKGFSYPGSGGTYQFVYSPSVMQKLQGVDETEIPIAPPQS